MDIKQLRYFMEVSRQKSFRKAAETLYISQQGLSMSILRLESELSCKLFKRAAREGLILTEQGQFLYTHAEEINRHFEECEEYFEQNSMKEKTLFISSAFGIMPDSIGKLLFDFQLEHQNTLVSVKEYPDKNCEDAIDNDEVELGFSLGPISSKRFDSSFLFSRNYCFVVPSSHPFAAEKTASLDMLRQAPLIMVNEDFKMHHILMDSCRKRGVEPKIRFLAGEIASVHRLAQMNYGIGLSVERVALETGAPNICILPFEDPDLMWSAYIVKKRGRVLSAEAKAFWRHIVRHAEAQPETQT